MKIVLWVSSQAAASPGYVTRTVDWSAVPRKGEIVGAAAGEVDMRVTDVFWDADGVPTVDLERQPKAALAELVACGEGWVADA